MCLAADAVSLLRTWWYQDRIRSSPREGKLLRLTPGAILRIEGTTIEVESRQVIQTEEGSILKYRCRHTDSHSELWIKLQPCVILTWSDQDRERDLVVDDIEVWSEGIRGPWR